MNTGEARRPRPVRSPGGRAANLLALALTALLAGTPGAAAQDTRAEELQAKRAEKAAQLREPERSRTESLLYKIEDDLVIERLLAPPRGVHLRLGGIGEGAGFGLGPGYRYSTGAFDFRVSAAASLKRYGIVESALLLPGALREGPFVELYARRRDFPQEDFFGIGPDSAAGDRSNYALRDTLVRATGGVRTDDFSAGLRVGHYDPSIGRGTDRRMPPTEDVFAPWAVAGLASQPSFAVFEPFVEYSYTDPRLNPTSGGSYRFRVARYADRDFDRFSFTRWDLDLRQYIPLLHDARTLALRAWASSSTADTGHEVPFYLQPTLGGGYALRGFPSFRFRDRSVLLLQGEYRWKINEFVSGALFYETGGVAPRLSDLDAFERSYGFGLRAGSRNGVAFRTDVAFGSGEGTRLLVRFDHVF
jgi:hypothetical protein